MLDEKIIKNAQSAYFMIFISLMFLFNKHDSNINNDFVKSHTKTAFFIHLLFLIIYIVFIHYWLLSNFSILWYNLNFILASILFILSFSLLLLGIYNAHIWNRFKIWSVIKSWEKWDIFNIKKVKIWEKDKTTFILSFIPFIWYIIYTRYPSNELVKNIAKFNLSVSLFITVLFISWYSNLAILLILVYIVFIVFFSIMLVFNDEIIVLNLYFIPTFEEVERYIDVSSKYIRNYFKKWAFTLLNKLVDDEKNRDMRQSKLDLEELNSKNEISLSKNLIYLPIFNFVFLFFLNSKYKFHIINWFYISLLFIVSWWVFWFRNDYQVLLIFPIFYWIWYVQNRLNYRMPLIYNLHLLLSHIFFFTKLFKSKVDEKRKEENFVSMKVGEWERKVEDLEVLIK